MIIGLFERSAKPATVDGNTGEDFPCIHTLADKQLVAGDDRQPLGCRIPQEHCVDGRVGGIAGDNNS